MNDQAKKASPKEKPTANKGGSFLMVTELSNYLPNKVQLITIPNKCCTPVMGKSIGVKRFRKKVKNNKQEKLGIIRGKSEFGNTMLSPKKLVKK